MTPKTKRGRAEIAQALFDLAMAHGAGVVEVTAQWPEAPSNETMVRIVAGDACVGIGIAPLEASNGYVVPWNILADSEARFSSAFAVAVGATVNPYHRRKCMGWYGDERALLAGVRRALDCIAAGDAFMVMETV